MHLYYILYYIYICTPHLYIHIYICTPYAPLSVLREPGSGSKARAKPKA